MRFFGRRRAARQRSNRPRPRPEIRRFGSALEEAQSPPGASPLPSALWDLPAQRTGWSRYLSESLAAWRTTVAGPGQTRQTERQQTRRWKEKPTRLLLLPRPLLAQMLMQMKAAPAARQQAPPRRANPSRGYLQKEVRTRRAPAPRPTQTHQAHDDPRVAGPANPATQVRCLQTRAVALPASMATAWQVLAQRARAAWSPPPRARLCAALPLQASARGGARQMGLPVQGSALRAQTRTHPP